MKLSVVIAAYNERENVVPLTERLRATLDSLAVDWELLYVVEGSDGTREALEAMAPDVPRMKVLYRAEPSGLGAAFRRGFAAVRPDADVVVTMDADLNHQPEEIPALLAAREASGADIVVGSRFVHGSSVTGIPFWKKALSTSMNAAMRFLWGLKTRDKTSGFRLYGAEVLRNLSFRNDNFAFLPELLIDATRKGYSILEVPIRFTVRVHGVSKMHILTTSRSYLSLLRSRWDGWSLFALFALLGGISLRALYTYPVHRYLADADSLLTGMRAFRILEGHTPVFYSGVRIGALESYIHAAVFTVFGASRATITVAPFFSGILALLAFFFLARRLVGRQAACFALLVFAFPPASFLFWTYMPNGYPETVLLSLAAIWAAAESREHPGSAALPVAFGLLSGLALWNSLQALACVAPGAILLLRSRRGPAGTARALGLAAAGFVLGAAPWIAYNVIHPLASFQGNFATQPVAGSEDLVANLKRFALVQLPELVVTGDVEAGGTPLAGWRRPAALALVALNVAAVLLAFRRPPEALRRGRTIAQGLLPLGLAGMLAVAFFVFSEAGRTPGPTTRYLLFVLPLLSACLGLLLARVSLRSFPLALALGLGVVLFDLSSYALLPGRALRRHLEAGASADVRFVSFLENHRIGSVVGDYWVVYPINFLSKERTLGIPVDAPADWYRYEARLPAGPSTWALASWRSDELGRLARRTGAAGETLEAAPGTLVVLPRDPDSPHEALARLRRTP
ncbi:MAG: glycosyltransferase [Acidobacteriota bacterium]